MMESDPVALCGSLIAALVHHWLSLGMEGRLGMMIRRNLGVDIGVFFDEH